MAFSSYRAFVEALDQAGELKRVSQPVATELEITELADREMKSPGGGKALLFEKPTVNGVVSPFPVAINTMGSEKRMAMSMNAASVEEVAADLATIMKAKPPTSLREAMTLLGAGLELRHARPKRVKTGPCKDVVYKIESRESKVESWPPAPDWQQPSTFDARPDSARPSDSQMLAVGRRTVCDAPLCGDAGPGYRRGESWNVSCAGL